MVATNWSVSGAPSHCNFVYDDRATAASKFGRQSYNAQMRENQPKWRQRTTRNDNECAARDTNSIFPFRQKSYTLCNVCPAPGRPSVQQHSERETFYSIGHFSIGILLHWIEFVAVHSDGRRCSGRRFVLYAASAEWLQVRELLLVHYIRSRWLLFSIYFFLWSSSAFLLRNQKRSAISHFDALQWETGNCLGSNAFRIYDYRNCVAFCHCHRSTAAAMAATDSRRPRIRILKNNNFIICAHWAIEQKWKMKIAMCYARVRMRRDSATSAMWFGGNLRFSKERETKQKRISSSLSTKWMNIGY